MSEIFTTLEICYPIAPTKLPVLMFFEVFQALRRDRFDSALCNKVGVSSGITQGLSQGESLAEAGRLANTQKQVEK